jgi:hypothetical protein
MIEYILSFPTIPGMVIFIVAIVIMGFIPYLIGWRLFGKRTDERTQTIAIALFRALVLLLGLMLSMNFVATRGEYVKIQNSVDLEAREVNELFNDLHRFGSDESKLLQNKLAEYVKVVIEEEWPTLAQGQLNEMAWQLFLEFEDGIINLKTETAKQKILKQRLISDVDQLSDHRSVRITTGHVAMPWFLVVVLIGLLISTFMFSVEPPKFITLIFVSLYTAFIGLVLYSIIALNQPYEGLTNVSVEPLEIVYSGITTNK